VYYLYAKNPVFHQVAYATITLATTARGYYATEYELRPYLNKKQPATVDQQLRQIRVLAMTGGWYSQYLDSPGLVKLICI